MKETVTSPHAEHHAPALLHPFHPSPKANLLPTAPSPSCPLFFPLLETPVNLGCQRPGPPSGTNSAPLYPAAGAAAGSLPGFDRSLCRLQPPLSLSARPFHSRSQPAALCSPVLLLPALSRSISAGTHLRAELPGIAAHPQTRCSLLQHRQRSRPWGWDTHPDATGMQRPREKPIKPEPKPPPCLCSVCRNVSSVFPLVLLILGGVKILTDHDSSDGALLLCCVCNPLAESQARLITCLGKRLEKSQGHGESLQKNLGRARLLELQKKKKRKEVPLADFFPRFVNISAIMMSERGVGSRRDWSHGRCVCETSCLVEQEGGEGREGGEYFPGEDSSGAAKWHPSTTSARVSSGQR